MLFMFLSKDGKTPKGKKVKKPKVDAETSAMSKTMAKAEKQWLASQKKEQK